VSAGLRLSVASARRLSAIMFTDMVGFTARARANEADALRLLEEQEGLVRPLLAAHHGREVKSTGDGFLVEFGSALDAARCAVAIQERLRARNAGGAPAIELRIGIHLGDVEQRGNDIFGDAVNIASRIQPIAEAGGIAVTRQVYDQLENKLDLPLERLEPRALKGVGPSVEAYRIVLPWNRSSRASGTGSAPDRLAVLPFSNISPDPNDAYIGDGLTEEVISVLSQLAGLRVIARTSVDPYKANPKPIPQVGAELGVAWVLEGSVRKAGPRLRITVQLIDVRSQEHLWADTYDRALDDVFALQSELARRVAEALRVRLLAGEEARLDRRKLPTPDSYLAYLEGRAALRGIGESDLRLALDRFERAIRLDPTNAAAHAGLADVHAFLGGLYHHLPRSEWEAASEHHAREAIRLDPELAEAHTSLALRHLDAGRYAEAEPEFRRALALNPSYSESHSWYGTLLAELGRPEEALAEWAQAQQLDPLASYALAEEVSFLVQLRQMERVPALLERLAQVDRHGLLYQDRRFSVAVIQGNRREMHDALDELERGLPGRPEITVGRAFLLLQEGEPDRARALLKPVEELGEPERPDHQLAMIYARLGDLDRCFRWLDVTVDVGRFSSRLYRYDPDFEKVRNDPRFRQLLKRVGLA
jgi:adenylate cyclase